MNPKEFEKIVAEAFEMIPEKVRSQMSNVALLIEDEPDEKTLQENSVAVGSTLLGLYKGIPKTERGDTYGVGPTLPDSITIYRKPIIDAAAKESGVLELITWGEQMTEPLKRRVRDMVRDTLWHEIAHYLGMNEEEVEVREIEGTNKFKERTT